MSSSVLLSDYRKFLKDRTVSVLGIGTSNIPLISFLLSCGAKVTARDKKELEILSKNQMLNINSLINQGVKFITGENYLEELNEKVIFKTPGIRYDTEQIINASKNDSYITSEMEAFLLLCPSKVFAITGSDGKTTTTTIISKLLAESGHTVHLGGNIGNPLISEIDKIKNNDMTVLELSSFQLHAISMQNKSSPFPSPSFPDVGVLTNVSPNHLDWHKDYDEYINSKKVIFNHMEKGSHLVTNFDCSISKEISKEAEEKGIITTLFSSKEEVLDGYFLKDNKIIGKNNKEILNVSDILLLGKHNLENYMAAIAATYSFVSELSIKTVATNFSGVSSRLELIREKDGIRFYNSSIDSSPTRTAAALNSFETSGKKNLIVIMGGKDKNVPFDDLGCLLCQKAKAVFIASTGDGSTAKKIEDAIKNCPSFTEKTTKVILLKNWEDTILQACLEAESGDNVLLSPACTSFDVFQNFEERGLLFKKIVGNL